MNYLEKKKTYNLDYDYMKVSLIFTVWSIYNLSINYKIQYGFNLKKRFSVFGYMFFFTGKTAHLRSVVHYVAFLVL